MHLDLTQKGHIGQVLAENKREWEIETQEGTLILKNGILQYSGSIVATKPVDYTYTDITNASNKAVSVKY